MHKNIVRASVQRDLKHRRTSRGGGGGAAAPPVSENFGQNSGNEETIIND